MTCQHALCITLGVGKILHPGNGRGKLGIGRQGLREQIPHAGEQAAHTFCTGSQIFTPKGQCYENLGGAVKALHRLALGQAATPGKAGGTAATLSPPHPFAWTFGGFYFCAPPPPAMLTSYCAAKGEAFCQRAFFAGLLSPPCLWLLWLAIRKLRTVAAIRLDSKPRGLKVPAPARPRHGRLPAPPAPCMCSTLQECGETGPQ